MGTVAALVLLAVLLPIQARVLLAFLATSVLFWFLSEASVLNRMCRVFIVLYLFKNAKVCGRVELFKNAFHLHAQAL